MSNNKKWAVIIFPSLMISAIHATPNLLSLAHSDHRHHPEVPPLPVALDYDPHLAHPPPLTHGKDPHHNLEKHPLPLAHDPHKHDHHHYQDPYVSKHKLLKHTAKSLLNEISKISIIEKALPIKSGRLIKMDDPYLIAHKHGPPYSTKDYISLINGVHQPINSNPPFLSTKNKLDSQHAIKSIPLVLNNPHAFKNFIGKRNVLSPFSNSHLNDYGHNDFKNKFLKDHEIIKMLPVHETNVHDPNLVETFTPLVNGHHGLHHDIHHHHYDPYVRILKKTARFEWEFLIFFFSI